MRYFLSIGLMLAAAGVVQAEVPNDPNQAVRMTSSQIAAHNASLESTNPAYIKCVRSEGPGSLVARRVCRTQEDWNRRAEVGQREARDIVDNIQLRGSTYPQEPSFKPVGGF